MQKKKILVVDDEVEVTSTLEGYFKAKGYQMFTALSGKEAIDIVEREPVDLVLLDMKMPGIDGVEVLKNIREKWSPARVMVITGFAEEYKDAIREAGGAEGLMTKPVALGELTERIDEILTSSPRVAMERGMEDFESLRKALGSPPLEPSEKRILAKLLFVEPVSTIYQAFFIHFRRRLEFNEEYKIRWAHTRMRAFEELGSFKPDIVLLNFTNLHNCDEVAVEMLNSQHRPKEIIIYGTVLSKEDKEKIEKLGAKSSDISFFSPKQVDQLIKLVRDTALRHGLVEA